jgi:SAM-dependent methyltransferase
MVSARGRFLAGGHFAPMTLAVRDAAGAAWRGGLVLDVGAGTAHHLGAVLDALPDAWGLALDSSKAAARSASRAHERADAVVADAWQPLPLADGSVGALLDVFAPRNPHEFARVLRDDGLLLVVTPAADHLNEVVDALGLLHVDPEKPARLADALAAFDIAGSDRYQWIMELDHDAVGAIVGMGPSAWHAESDVLADRIGGLPAPMHVTASVVLTLARKRG